MIIFIIFNLDILQINNQKKAESLAAVIIAVFILSIALM